MSYPCACGSSNPYSICCQPLHEGKAFWGSPEQLMRSRYAAYAENVIEYLIETTHPRMRYLHAKEDIASWAQVNNWQELEIVDAFENIVEFKAHFIHKGSSCVHHEISVFEKEGDKWYYVSGTFPKS